MHNQRTSRPRRAALFNFALAAALATSGFTMLPQRAEAVSASASEAAYTPVSPRELGVSIPSTPTIRTVEAPRQTPPPENTPSSETRENRRAARRQNRTRVRERREETTTAEHHRTVRREVATDNSKEMENKNPVVIPPAPSPFQFSLSGGWQSRYIYHGLDIISFNSRYRSILDPKTSALIGVRRESSSIWFTDASMAWKGLRFGVGYVQAVDPTVAFFNGGVGRSVSAPGDTLSLYREVDIHLDYTHSIVPNWLDGTIGYNSYIFPNKDFKGTNYQGEIPIRLTFTRIPYVRPSFTYYRYVSDYKDRQAGNLNGNYVEFRLDGGFPLFESRNFGVALAPFALISYNINYLRYNDEVGGWNTFEAGLKVPVRIGQHFTITPFFTHGSDISGDQGSRPGTFSPINNFTNKGFGERTHVWGGVNLAYSF